MQVSCRHWSAKIGAVFFYSRKEDKDGNNDDMFLAIATLVNDTDLGQWLIVTDATGDRWVKCEELRFRGDAAYSAWRKATVDEIIEHFKNR